MVGQRMGAVDGGWEEFSVKLVKLNTETHEREEKRRQTRVDEATSVIRTGETTGDERKQRKQLRNTLLHLVQSRWVCASLQQQAHEVGLVLLRRHVKGRLPILQVGRGKVEGDYNGGERERDRQT